jgi:hypothetical protein
MITTTVNAQDLVSGDVHIVRELALGDSALSKSKGSNTKHGSP